MRNYRLNRVLSGLSAVLVAWLAIAPPAPARAEIREFVTVRRALGLAFVGGSAALAAQGFDYRSEADDFYDAYEVAVDPVEIDRLYQRTTNRDVKAQVSWALAAAFGISGLRLILTGDAEIGDTARLGPDRNAGAAVSDRQSGGAAGMSPAVSIAPIADGRQVGLQLSRHFF